MRNALNEWALLVLLLGAIVVMGGPLGRWVRSDTATVPAPDPTGHALAAGPIERLDLALYDAGLWLAAVPPDPSVLIVAIDDQSIGQVGRWPWPRAVTAELIRRVAASGPASLGIDILFAEPGAGDAALADAIRTARPILAVAREQGRDGRFLPLYPLRALADDARLAHVVMSYGSDGLVRGLYAQEGHLPALARAMTDPGARADLAGADQMIATGAWPRSSPLMPRALSVGPQTVSAAAVLRGEIDSRLFTGRRVLVGTTSVGIGDVFSTPLLAGRMQASGVELHAVATSALLGASLISPLAPGLVAALGFAILVLMMVLLYRLPPRNSIVVCVSTIAGVIALTLLGLQAGVWFAPASLLVALALAYPLWSWRRLSAAVAGLRLQTRTLRPRTTLFDNLNRDPGTIEPVSRRISHLANASMQVQRLNRFLQDGMESLPHPVVVTDPKGLVMYRNLRMIDAFDGVPPVIGSPVGDWFASQFGAPLPLDPSGEIRERELGDGRGRQWLVSLTQTGEADVDNAVVMMRGDDLVARRWLLQLVEITALRAAEREREEALTFLSHDLRSPQAAILSMTDDDGTAAPALDRVALSRHATRALELTDQFLSFARAGSKPIELAEYDLVDLVTETVDLCWHKSRDRNVRLEGEAAVAEALISVDIGLLRRAVLNLIENAIRHCESGGRVSVRLDSDRGDWTIAVEDDGPGIPPDALGSLFQAFWQRPAGTVGGNVGAAGLGLAMVERTMSRHQGSVTAQNRTDRTGARFTIRLPGAPAATMPLKSASQPPGAS